MRVINEFTPCHCYLHLLALLLTTSLSGHLVAKNRRARCSSALLFNLSTTNMHHCCLRLPNTIKRVETVMMHNSVCMATAIQEAGRILRRRDDWKPCFWCLPLLLFEIWPVAKLANMWQKNKALTSCSKRLPTSVALILTNKTLFWLRSRKCFYNRSSLLIPIFAYDSRKIGRACTKKLLWQTKRKGVRLRNQLERACCSSRVCSLSGCIAPLNDSVMR